MNNIEVITGDTAVISLGIGGSASRQTVTAGSSAFLAAQAVRKKVLKVASHILEAPEEDLEIEGTEVRVKGVSSLKISMQWREHRGMRYLTELIQVWRPREAS